MSQPHATDSQSSSSSFVNSFVSSVITKKHAGLATAGVFVFAGAAFGLNAANDNHGIVAAANHTTTNTATVQQAGTATAPDASSPNPATTDVSSSAGGGTSHLQVTVNGQDIPVPANGTVDTTVTSADGTNQSTVSAHSTSATPDNGNASNSNSTSLTVQVTDSSTGGESNP